MLHLFAFRSGIDWSRISNEIIKIYHFSSGQWEGVRHPFNSGQNKISCFRCRVENTPKTTVDGVLSLSRRTQPTDKFIKSLGITRKLRMCHKNDVPCRVNETAQQVVYDVMPHCLEFGYYEAIQLHNKQRGKNSFHVASNSTHYSKYPINCGP